MQLVVKSNDKSYDITELITKISFTDKLNDGCSKLEFTYLNSSLKIVNGSVLWFKNDDTEFYGYVFKVFPTKGNKSDVTAYDQLRYAKSKDYQYFKNSTLKTMTDKMCNYFNFNKGTIDEPGYILKPQLFDNQTWLDMIYSGINETLTNTQELYCLRDEFGKIAIRNIKDLTINLIIGDESLCYDFSYGESIDDDFYNQIILLVKNGDSVKFIGSNDENSIKKYGMLQYFETVENANDSQAKAKANALLNLYNSEKKTLTLPCLGDTRVRAGCSVYGKISEINLNKKLLVKSVTHNFLPVHTMDLEVML